MDKMDARYDANYNDGVLIGRRARRSLSNGNAFDRLNLTEFSKTGNNYLLLEGAQNENFVKLLMVNNGNLGE